MAQPQRQTPPVTSVAGPASGKTDYLPSDLPRPQHQQQHAIPNHYLMDVDPSCAGNFPSGSSLHQVPSHRQVTHVGGDSNAPPPLPPKPGPKPLPRAPLTGGTQFPHQGPPRGNPFNFPSSGGIPSNQPLSSQHYFNTQSGGAPSMLGSNEPQYNYILDPKEQELIRERARASDAVSKLRERELELSQCHSEMANMRQCVSNKKDEVKSKEQEITRLTDELDRLRMVTNGRAQPHVAGSEAALQVEVQQYKRVVQELRTENEQLRRQQNVAPPPPPTAATDMQELMRLRGEVQWHHGERQRMLQEIGALKSSEQVLAAQVGTYREDFETERQDRERAHARIDQMREEIANLNHIITMLGGQEQQHQNPYPP